MVRVRLPPATLVALATSMFGCTVPVAAAIDEGDANRVVVALDQSGIDASKESDPTADGKFRVMVPRDEVARALATLREEELPRPKARGVLDAADRGQLVASQAREHAELVLGLAGELEKTLASIDGVLAARVHLNVPPREPLREAAPAKATASVLVEHRGTTPPLAPDSIQRLVSGGAPGVAPADVAVVFVPRVPRTSASRADLALAHVGPITVVRTSMNMLKIVLSGLVVVVLGLAAATLALWAKVMKLRREQDGSLAAAAPTAAAPRALTGPQPIAAPSIPPGSAHASIAQRDTGTRSGPPRQG